MKTIFNFSFLNLGCTKNLVDTQYLMGKIFDLGQNNPHYKVNYNTDPYDTRVEYVFLNTCGFLKSGRDEMFKTIEKLLRNHSKSHISRKIYLMGCALQFFKTLAKEDEQWQTVIKNPNIHGLSRNDFEKISLSRLIQGYDSQKFQDFTFADTTRAYTNATFHFEYLKIAEGCDNHCTFCIIPSIRGRQKSVPIPKLLTEIKNMINAGIEEIIIISQDTTRYGTDLYGKPSLFKLLQSIEKIPGKFHYRLLYFYPDTLSLEHFKKLKKFKKFLHYFDIPFQHISSDLLKKMGRFYNKAQTLAFLDFIKKNFPVSFIRTNIIIGFPGETEENFQELKTFIQESDIDNLALFEYHDETLAVSYKLPNKIPEQVIRERFLELDTIVDKKITVKEEQRKGKKFTGYIMKIKSSTQLIVRPQLHAPDIDPYDTISLEQITKLHNSASTISLGDKITYIL